MGWTLWISRPWETPEEMAIRCGGLLDVAVSGAVAPDTAGLEGAPTGADGFETTVPAAGSVFSTSLTLSLKAKSYYSLVVITSALSTSPVSVITK